MSIDLETKIITTTPYNISNSDEVIFVNITSGPASIILPLMGNDGSKKRSYHIKDYSGTSGVNPITITAAGGKTIDGVSFAMLNGSYSYVYIIYDGTNWKTI